MNMDGELKIGARTCPNCGKTFHVTSYGWGYAVGAQYVCSYKCMRQWEAEKMTKQEKEDVRRMAEAGKTPEQIARQLGLSERAVAVSIGMMKKKLERYAEAAQAAQEPAAPAAPEAAAEAPAAPAAVAEPAPEIPAAELKPWEGAMLTAEPGTPEEDPEEEIRLDEVVVNAWKALGALEAVIALAVTDARALDRADEALQQIELALTM